LEQVADIGSEDAGGDADARADLSIHPDQWPVGEVVATCGNGLLAVVPTDYGDVYVVRVQGDHHEMGWQYGCLVGPMVVDLWWAFMTMLAESESDIASAEAADLMMGVMLDLAWEKMAPHVHPLYLEELEAIGEGAEHVGVEPPPSVQQGVGSLVGRIHTMLEVSQTHAYSQGIDEAIAFINTGASPAFFDYFADGRKQGRAGRAGDSDRRGILHTCSTFAAWGDRTADHHLLASRVLDWDTDTGIADYKLITVYVPDDGYASMTVGYAGCPMAGMSENGLAMGMVGSASVLERMEAGSGLFRMREVLEFAADLDGAVPYFTNEVGDGVNRANSIGGNVTIVWGDPAGGGAAARAVALETNAVFTGLFEGRPFPDCGHDAALYEFDEQGWLAAHLTHEQDPDRVNLEAETYEIDVDGQIRTFQVDADGEFVMVDGHYTDDPDGEPMLVGKPLGCALFRGDEAMAYGVRRWQSAAHGPWSGDGTGVMVQSGSYRHRYTVMHDMLRAYETGTEYVHDDQVVIEDNGGQPVAIGLQEGGRIAAEAAMGSNVLNVVYDATALEMLVAYESGTGDGWTPASANPYALFDLEQLVRPW
jgi:hypothetical protein